MEKIKLKDIQSNKKLRNKIAREIKKGKVFIYPTDTVYGLGCNAMKSSSVSRLREIKNTDHPLSIIAPSRDWIKKKFHIKHKKYLEKLPGPYTLIMEKKRQVFLFWVGTPKTLGVRIPDHPFTKVVQKSGVPFITTSANTSGKKIPKSIGDLETKLKDQVDYIVDAGKLGSKPSTVIDISRKTPKTIRK